MRIGITSGLFIAVYIDRSISVQQKETPWLHTSPSLECNSFEFVRRRATQVFDFVPSRVMGCGAAVCAHTLLAVLVTLVQMHCCTGKLATAKLAQHYSEKNNPVGQSCITGDVRLFGGMRPTEGTVEVCVNGEWQTICDSYWETNDATVICSQLGYSTTARLLAFKRTQQ